MANHICPSPSSIRRSPLSRPERSRLIGPRVTETVAEILAAHRAGTLSPAQTVARSYRRIRERDDPAIFISLRDEKEAVAEAERLAANKDAAQLPLFGIPIAVKDNIDVAGLPTTSACPAFAYTPARDAIRGDAAARGRRHRARQDQSRPVRHGLVGVPLALRHPQKSAAGGSDSGRIEFGLGGRGIDRTGAAGARYRHRGKRPRAGDAQQHRGPEAEPRVGFRPRGWCRRAGRWIVCRYSRSPSTTRWPRCR